MLRLTKQQKPPLCKGRCHAASIAIMTEGLFMKCFALLILPNDSITIPHPLRGSSLCTREPVYGCATRELFLLGEPVYMGLRDSSLYTREPFTVCTPQNSICRGFLSMPRKFIDLFCKNIKILLTLLANGGKITE